MANYLKKILTILCLFIGSYIYAQTEYWSFEDCVNHALKNNLSIRIQKLQVDHANVNINQNFGAMLPSVFGNINHSYNYGRTVDRFTNQFALETVRSNNFYASANVSLFNGFQLLNNFKKSRIDYQAALYDLQVLQNDITLTIATAFLQILYSKEMVVNAEKQLEITNNQLVRSRKLFELGGVSKAEIKNLEAQFASEEFQLVNMQIQHEMALLNLKQLLDLPTEQEFKILAPSINTSEIIVPYEYNTIVKFAQRNQPEIKSAELKLESAKKSKSIAKGAFMPSISLGVSLGTGYSGASRRLDGMKLIGYDTVGITTSVVPEFVLAPVYDYIYNPIPFNNQITDNFNSVIGFHISIPIFNSLISSSNLRRSNINIETAQLSLQQANLNVSNVIAQAHHDAVSAFKKLQSAQKKLIATQESFDIANEKFALEDISLLEYQNSKNQFIMAESEVLQAKYELLFKNKVLDFYLGKNITF